MERLLGQHWHHLPSDEAVTLLSSDPVSGLTVDESARRQARFGPNALPPPKRQSPWLRFLIQFHQPLIYILLAATAITLLLREFVDAGVIFAVVLVNAIVGFLQESRAVAALDALARAVTTPCTVLRDGQRQEVPSETLVPGDLVLLHSGDKVPADLRLLATRELRCAEAALTGESLPVEKATQPLDPATPLAERSNMAYASALVTYGQGRGLVVATGAATEVGRISELIAEADELQTPLVRKIARFSQVLLYAIVALAGVTFLVGTLRGEPAFDMFMAAVALAVGAIPEGLPAAVTITLAIGVARMAQRRAIIRRLPAVETLGSTTVICSDKTGTLTQNQMTVQAVLAGGAAFTLTGGGYAPEGQLRAEGGAPVTPVPGGALHECLLAGVLCNDSHLVQDDGRWEIRGDPTEGALLAGAAKAGIDPEAVGRSWPRIDAIPFESQHRYMATLHAPPPGPASAAQDPAPPSADRPRTIYVKGAPEALLPRCVQQLALDGGLATLDRETIAETLETLAARGLRVLALARTAVRAEVATVDHADVAGGLVLLGIQGMLDPPRPEAVTAVATCQRAGVMVKMITGDHPLTAADIARKLGIAGAEADAEAVVTGERLAALPDDALPPLAEERAVFARVSPEDKLRLVRALQDHRHVVAMTGDGVNDAPALKQADIGVAMGVGGTEVAKEASDMVLTDDNFATIQAAVEEGRGVFDNLTKFIVWTLPTNLGEALVILTAVFAGIALPITPLQILWINMTTAMLLGLTLAFEPMEPGIMERAPRDPRRPLLTGELLGRIALVGTFLVLAAFGLFELALAGGASLEEARTVAVNVFIVVEAFYLFNCRCLERAHWRVGLFSNRWTFGGVSVMLGLQLAFTYWPPFQAVFGSAPITLAHWCWIVGAGLAGHLLVGFEKWLRHGRGRKPAGHPVSS